MKVSAQYAETHFSELLDAARSGECVEIAEPEKPTLTLVVSDTATHTAPRSPRIPGRLAGKLGLPPDWEAEFRRLDEEMTQAMVAAPLTADGDL